MELISFTAPQLRRSLPAAIIDLACGCKCGHPDCSEQALVYSGPRNLNPAMPRLPFKRRNLDIRSPSCPESLLPLRSTLGHRPSTSSPPAFFGAERHHDTRDHGCQQGSVLVERSSGNELDSMIRSAIALSAGGLAKTPVNISGRLPTLITLDVSVSAGEPNHFHRALYLLSQLCATSFEGGFTATATTPVHHRCTKKVDVHRSCPSSRGSMCGQGSPVLSNKNASREGKHSSDCSLNPDGSNGAFAVSENMQDRSFFVQSMTSAFTLSTLLALVFQLVKRSSPSEERKLSPWEAGTMEGLLQTAAAIVGLLSLKVVLSSAMKNKRKWQLSNKCCCPLEDPG